MIEKGEKSGLELGGRIEKHSRGFYSCILYVQKPTVVNKEVFFKSMCFSLCFYSLFGIEGCL